MTATSATDRWRALADALAVNLRDYATGATDWDTPEEQADAAFAVLERYDAATRPDCARCGGSGRDVVFSLYHQRHVGRECRYCGGSGKAHTSSTLDDKA
jgi:hypothetical protein